MTAQNCVVCHGVLHTSALGNLLVFLVVVNLLALAARRLHRASQTLRVHVHAKRGETIVTIGRWEDGLPDGHEVARFRLDADDADERLAEAKMLARDRMRQLNAIRETR